MITLDSNEKHYVTAVKNLKYYGIIEKIMKHLLFHF